MLKKISFDQALQLILDNTPRLGSEEIELAGLVGRVLASEVLAKVDSPSVDASLKDGFALHSEDVAGASPENRKPLVLVGSNTAGGQCDGYLNPGEAMRVTTGASLPPGADAVLAGEFADVEDGKIFCFRDAGPGRNILPRGTDVLTGDVIAGAGERLHPALIGLLAAAGLDRAVVYRKPKIAVIGTGDEIVLPGAPLPEGRLYASNMVETTAWLKALGFDDVRSGVAPDKAEKIIGVIRDMKDKADVFITSGGAWGSERDLMLDLLDTMGWQGFFHRVRLGPGKAAAYGLLEGKPFFILPGGPPSHEAAFLLLALPGIFTMSGRGGRVFKERVVELTDSVYGQADWTQVVHLVLERTQNGLKGRPVKSASRLSSMASKNAILLIPEGRDGFEAGESAKALVLVEPD